MNKLNKLVRDLVNGWPYWEEHEHYYLKDLLPKLKKNPSFSELAESQIIEEIKITSSKKEWNNLGKIVWYVKYFEPIGTINIDEINKDLRIKSKQIEQDVIEQNFEEADSLFKFYRNIIPFSELGPSTKEYFKGKAKIKLDEIEGSLKSFNFDEADELYQKDYHYIQKSEYNDLKSKYIKEQNQQAEKKAQDKINMLNEIEKAMEDNDFSMANEIYQQYKNVILESDYNRLKKRHMERIAQVKLGEIEQTLKHKSFSEADELYQQYKNIVLEADYIKLKKRYLERVARIKLGEIEQTLKHNNFSEADELYQQSKNTVLETDYIKLKKKHMERVARIKLGEIEQTLEVYSFAKADKLYESNKAYVAKEKYLALKKKYQKNQIEADVLSLLKERNYFDAENIVAKSPLISSKEYEVLRRPYLKQDLKRIINLPITDKEAFETIQLIIKHESALINKLSLNKIKQFVIDHIGTFTFPFVLYQSIINDINDSLQSKKTTIDENNIYRVVVEFLNSSSSPNVDLMPLWNIFSFYPEILGKVCSRKRNLLDRVDDTYPYEHLETLGPHYFPTQETVLHFIKSEKIYADKKLCSLLKKQLTENKYFNCEMYFSLRQAMHNDEPIALNDILRNLLKRIVNKTFDYHRENKKYAENLIFPKCISFERTDRFRINDDKNIFCEGHLINPRTDDGEAIVLCRNRRCIERSEYIDDKTSDDDDDFLRILRNVLNFSKDEIFKSDHFTRGLGAFNRWNEILDRLFCGYNDKGGCGSTLIYSSVYQASSGWAAYATTYWYCSNGSCVKNQEIIKLSHCRGCRKIIDSRFDRQRCQRKDKKDFYICMDCGYCCSQHEVSWRCPKCGFLELKNDNDPNGKRYRCNHCDQVINIPLWLKPKLLGKPNIE